MAYFGQKSLQIIPISIGYPIQRNETKARKRNHCETNATRDFCVKDEHWIYEEKSLNSIVMMDLVRCSIVDSALDLLRSRATCSQKGNEKLLGLRIFSFFHSKSEKNLLPFSFYCQVRQKFLYDFEISILHFHVILLPISSWGKINAI